MATCALKVVVVGAGICGLSCAVGLKIAGHDVTVSVLFFPRAEDASTQIRLGTGALERR